MLQNIREEDLRFGTKIMFIYSRKYKAENVIKLTGIVSSV